MTKIIFLDIDGVLNNNSSIQQDKDFPVRHLDHDACLVLKEIVEKTKAKVVISSTWRFIYYDFLVKHLATYKIKVIDKTGQGCRHCVRGNEILTWIKDNEKVIGCDYYVYRNYVILDDSTDMLYWQKDNFVKINNDFGLTNNYVDTIISILNQEGD
jgi:hypothetical protein